MNDYLRKINNFIDARLTAPIENAAGRIGLFRILYALFYLWYLSPNYAALLSGYPRGYRNMLVVRYFPEALPPIFFECLEFILVAALVILIIGFRVRLTTTVVLCAGLILDGFHNSFDVELASVFLVFYIPLFMLFSGHWGDTYSLDAHLAYRKKGAGIEPSNNSGSFFLPVRCLFFVLGVLFLGSAILKMTFGGTWLSNPRFMANLVLKMNIESNLYGLMMIPFAPDISVNPLIYKTFQGGTLIFEATFICALFSRKLRNIYICWALIFHSVCALWLTVTFTTIIVIYLAYVDWHALLIRLKLKRITLFDSVSRQVLISITICLAVLVGALWNLNDGMRSLVTMGGLVNIRTIWYPILSIALVCLLKALKSFVSSTGSRGTLSPNG